MRAGIAGFSGGYIGDITVVAPFDGVRMAAVVAQDQSVGNGLGYGADIYRMKSYTLNFSLWVVALEAGAPRQAGSSGERKAPPQSWASCLCGLRPALSHRRTDTGELPANNWRSAAFVELRNAEKCRPITDIRCSDRLLSPLGKRPRSLGVRFYGLTVLVIATGARRRRTPSRPRRSGLLMSSPRVPRQSASRQP